MSKEIFTLLDKLCEHFETNFNLYADYHLAAPYLVDAFRKRSLDGVRTMLESCMDLPRFHAEVLEQVHSCEAFKRFSREFDKH